MRIKSTVLRIFSMKLEGNEKLWVLKAGLSLRIPHYKSCLCFSIYQKKRDLVEITAQNPIKVKWGVISYQELLKHEGLHPVLNPSTSRVEPMSTQCFAQIIQINVSQWKVSPYKTSPGETVWGPHHWTFHTFRHRPVSQISSAPARDPACTFQCPPLICALKHQSPSLPETHGASLH